MSTKRTGLRLPTDLARRIERWRAYREAAEPGLKISTNAATLLLIQRGLAPLRAEESARAKK